MTVARAECVICRRREGDPEMGREEVWEDDLWRLTMSVGGETLGFSYLEPKRHIPHITDLDGEEAASFGTVLARATRALRSATGAEVVYLYVFGGGIPHLHVHLAPHRTGDPLNDQMLRGEVEETHLPNGATMLVSRSFPPLPKEQHDRVLAKVRRSMRAEGSGRRQRTGGLRRPAPRSKGRGHWHRAEQFKRPSRVRTY